MLIVLVLLAACSDGSLDPTDGPASARLAFPEPIRWLDPGPGQSLRGVGDLDGDGLDDLAHVTTSGAGMCVVAFRPDVAGSVPVLPCMQIDLWMPRTFDVTDVDGDGEQDFVVVDSDGAITTFPATVGAPAEHLVASPGLSVQIPAFEVGDLDGDGIGDFVLGDPGDDTAGTNAGRVLVYRGNDGAAPTLLTTLTGAAGDALGATVDLADLDGDGRDDLVATAPGWTGEFDDEGAAFWWASTAEGLAARAVIGRGGRVSAGFGQSLATSDLDGDGDDDVLVGGSDPLQGSAGQARLYEGGPSGPSAAPVWSEFGGGNLGWAVGLPGDVDGDGFADLLVSAPYLPEGALFVYAGSPQGFPREPTDRLRPDVSQIGGLLRPAGDVDGNGIDDVIADEYVLFGHPGGLQNGAPDPDWTARDPYQVGRVLIATDLDGDGSDDLLVLRDPAGPGGGGVLYPGRLDVWRGRPEGLADAPTVQVTTTTVSQNRKVGVALVGDVAGSPGPNLLYWDPWLGGTGGVRLYPATGWTFSGLPTPVFERTGPIGTTGYATGATVGDFDGDGFGDLALADGATASIYAGTATGIADVPAWTVASPATRLLTVPDLDGDQSDEIVLTTDTRLDLYLGGPAFPSATVAWTRTLTSAVGASVVDLDGDGVSELLMPRGNWYRPADPGVFGVPVQLPDGPSQGAASGDFDQDGFPELIASVEGGRIGIYRGTSEGPDVVAPWWSDEGGWAEYCTAATVGDLDGNGSPDLITSYLGSPTEIRVYWSDLPPAATDTGSTDTGDTGFVDTGPADTGDTASTDTSDTAAGADDEAIGPGCSGCDGGPRGASAMAVLLALLALRRRAVLA